MKNLILYLIPILITTGCAKKKIITPEAPESVQIPVSVIDTSETVTNNIVEINKGIEIPVNSEESNTIDGDVIKEEAEISEFDPIKEDLGNDLQGESQTSITTELDFDQLFPDSIWTDYMTKRGDYLSLIAYNEYNNANEWRRIYEWNKKHWEERGIGPDEDNPNFIYPYRELDLKKPAENAIEWAYEHFHHEVIQGETLWTIAQKEYGDELAWVVLYWDNVKLIEDHDGKLHPGMQLKVRSELWPELD